MEVEGNRGRRDGRGEKDMDGNEGKGEVGKRVRRAKEEDMLSYEYTVKREVFQERGKEGKKRGRW